MEKLRRGFAIVKGSWAVLLAQRELMILPLVAALAIIALLVAFVAVDVKAPSIPKLDAQVTSPWFYLALALTYFTCAFVAIFCNAALVYCARRHIDGDRASLGQGLRAAAALWLPILGWSMLTATVGLVLKGLSAMLRNSDNDKVPFVVMIIGVIILAMIEGAWLFATYFVVPIIVVEKLGPFAALSRSSEIMRARWGEIAAGEGGMGLVAFLLALPLCGAWFWAMVTLVDTYTAGHVAPSWLLLTVVLLTAAVVGVVVLSTALSSIFMTALYSYAVDGRLPAQFGADLIEKAFVTTTPKAADAA